MTSLLKMKRSSLQARMTISYMQMTIGSVLVLEVLFLGTRIIGALIGGDPISTAVQTAQQYTNAISDYITSKDLSTAPTLIPDDPSEGQNTLIYNGSSQSVYLPSTKNVPKTIVLLISPKDTIITSSYPGKYPVGAQIAQLPPSGISLITSTLTGTAANAIDNTDSGRVAQATTPAWNVQHKVAGVVYVQIALPTFGAFFLSQVTLPLLISGVILFVLSAPLGGLFGMLTTRNLVRRLQLLVTATTLFADGQYAQRVQVTRADEIGQLEEQFNRMAEHLVTSIAQRQELASQNARLAERARISRDLHDAISQDLFSLKLLAGGLQTALSEDKAFHEQITIVKQTTTRILREMRALLLELRPIQLDQLDLKEALETSARAYSTRLGITVETHITAVSLSSTAEDALLRIAQEALSNAVRHSNASVIMLSLIPLEKSVEFTISDNGKGFALEGKDTAYGLGLNLMRERVQELKGTFKLYTAPGHGVRIQVCLPKELEA